MQSGGLDAARIAARAEHGVGSDIIENIAEALIKNAGGLERKLLSKSLQETLLHCAGFEMGIGLAEFQTRFRRYLNRYDPSSIVQLFLSLYFFNFVWFETADAFGADAASTASFEKEMQDVETICRRVVDFVWKKFERTGQPLDLSTARALIQDIEQHLRGPQVPDSR